MQICTVVPLLVRICIFKESMDFLPDEREKYFVDRIL